MAPLSVLHRSVRPARMGHTTRCGCLQSSPPSLRPGSCRSMGIGRSGSTAFGAKRKVHAYVARSDPNMGVRTGAKRSYFVDPKWERTRSAEARCKYANGEFDKAGSLIHRYGTLNGIATAKRSWRARCRRLHSREWTQVALFVGRPSARTARSAPVPTTCCPATSRTHSAAYVPEATGAAPCFA